MDSVEVKILQYVFRFRQMSWREETAIKLKGMDRLRTILSYALIEVSGLKVDSKEDAHKVLNALPSTVVERVFILYKGSYAEPRRFATMGLYKAPAPGKLVKRMEEVEKQRESIMDRVEQEMETKFGRQEVQETLEAERQMLKNSKGRGLTHSTPDANRFGTTPPTTPPVKQGVIIEKDKK